MLEYDERCRGGVGFDQVDWLPALQTWVEQGKAPASIQGTRASDGATRPRCPYPLQARYAGDGDTRDAANFSCEAPS